MILTEQPRSVFIYGVLLLVLVNVARIQELFAFLQPLHLGKVSLVLVFILFLISPKPKMQVPLLQLPQSKIVLAIFALCLFSVPFSVYQGQSFDQAVLNFPRILLFFFLLVYTVNSFRDLRKVLWAFIFGVILLAFFTIRSGGVGRLAASATYDPNDIALLFVITLPIIYFFMRSQKGTAKVILFGALLTLLFSFILTVSRGGFIGLLSITLLIFFKDSYSSWKVKLALLAIFVIFFAQLAPESYWDRIQTILTYEQDYNATEEYGRLALWQRGFRLMLENPFTGVGAGAIVTGIGYSYGAEGGKWLTVHNAFLQIGAELGVGGLVLFVLLILVSIFSLRRMRIKYAHCSGGLQDHLWLMTALEVSLWGYCVTAMFLSAAYFAMFYFLIALCCVLKKLEFIESGQGRFVETKVSLRQAEVKR